MSRTIDSGLSSELTADVTRPLYLLYLGFNTPLRLSSRKDISWGGYLWSSKGFEVNGFSWGAGGAQSGTIRLPNESNDMTAVVLGETTADKQVKLWVTYLDTDGNIVTPEEYAIGVMDGVTAGLDYVDLDVILSNSVRGTALRKRITAAEGFNFLPAPGTKITWGNIEITIERRRT